MALPKFPNTRIQCEKCGEATNCRELKPCKDFYPAIDSNFTDLDMEPENVRYQVLELAS